MTARYLSFALFDRRGGLRAGSAEGVDQDQLMPALRTVEQEIMHKRDPSAATEETIEQLRLAIATIEAATDEPRLRSL